MQGDFLYLTSQKIQKWKMKYLQSSKMKIHFLYIKYLQIIFQKPLDKKWNLWYNLRPANAQKISLRAAKSQMWTFQAFFVNNLWIFCEVSVSRNCQLPHSKTLCKMTKKIFEKMLDIYRIIVYNKYIK